MFLQHEFRNKLTYTGKVPRVAFTPRALQDQLEITELCDEEVGWLGTVSRLPNGDLLIEEIFLPKQEVHSTTTEIDPNWFQDVPEEKWDKVKFWGHSHNTMGTSPSGQDETQLADNAKGVDDFFIRGICNKKGRMELTIVLKDVKLTIEDARWYVLMPETEDTREIWKERIKDKVSPMRHSTQTNLYNKPDYGYDRSGRWEEGKSQKDGKKNKKSKNKNDFGVPQKPIWIPATNKLNLVSGYYVWDYDEQKFIPYEYEGMYGA